MKDPRVVFATIMLVVVGAFAVSERLKVAELSRQVAELREAAALQAENAKAEAAKLQKQIDDRKAVIVQMEEQRKTVAGSEPLAPEEALDADGKPNAAEGDFGGMMKKMFTDPSMKKMMRSTQMMGVKMMYADLAKELGLSADLAGQVMEVLGDRQMALTTAGMKMFSGESPEAASADEAATEDYDAQLVGMLGKDGMAKFTEFERTAPDRMQLQQYKQAFAANGVPLDDRESEGLLTIMKEERTKVPPSPLDPGAKDVGAAVKAMQSDETFIKLMADQAAADQRVLSRARNVLPPDKMVQFESIQTQGREMQKMGIEMGRQFLNQK